MQVVWEPNLIFYNWVNFFCECLVAILKYFAVAKENLSNVIVEKWRDKTQLRTWTETWFLSQWRNKKQHFLLDVNFYSSDVKGRRFERFNRTCFISINFCINREKIWSTDITSFSSSDIFISWKKKSKRRNGRKSKETSFKSSKSI